MKKSKELIKSVRNTHKHLRTIKAFFKEAGEKFTGLSKFMSKQITKLKSNPDVFDCFNRFLGFHQSYLEKYNNYFEFLGSSFTQKHSYLKAYGAELKNMSKVEDEVERVIEEIYYSKGKITAEEEESKLDEANKKLLFCSVNSLDEIGDQLIESFVDLMQVIFIRENTHELENRMIIQHDHLKKLRKIIHENVSDSSEALMEKLNILSSNHNLKLIGYKSQLDPPIKLEDLVLKKMNITKRDIVGLTSTIKRENSRKHHENKNNTNNKNHKEKSKDSKLNNNLDNRTEKSSVINMNYSQSSSINQSYNLQKSNKITDEMKVSISPRRNKHVSTQKRPDIGNNQINYSKKNRENKQIEEYKSHFNTQKLKEEVICSKKKDNRDRNLASEERRNIETYHKDSLNANPKNKGNHGAHMFSNFNTNLNSHQLFQGSNSNISSYLPHYPNTAKSGNNAYPMLPIQELEEDSSLINVKERVNNKYVSFNNYNNNNNHHHHSFNNEREEESENNDISKMSQIERDKESIKAEIKNIAIQHNRNTKKREAPLSSFPKPIVLENMKKQYKEIYKKTHQN
mmetsp:Transcript_18523/g.19148  ORF Transcript_18523/g.19148 Transcript_18523/m.19148 type:complete len:570 (+) Transcript_18523:81-1790(+)